MTVCKDVRDVLYAVAGGAGCRGLDAVVGVRHALSTRSDDAGIGRDGSRLPGRVRPVAPRPRITNWDGVLHANGRPRPAAFCEPLRSSYGHNERRRSHGTPGLNATAQRIAGP